MTAILKIPNGHLIPQDVSRRNVVPIIYTRGTHYDIGFDIGRTFAKMIRNFVQLYTPLNNTYLYVYNTEAGRRVYEESLECVKEQYPHYVREIEGTADGAEIPFYKLFLMHIDDIMPNAAGNGLQGNTEAVGCSSIICNHPGQEILGHNEDALSETMNHWYLVDAHVIEPEYKEEKFTSLSYAGFLPGYTMGYNHHGLVYSINTLSAKTLRAGKTPRYFLTRALLAVENYVQAQECLRNEGYGAAEGFSVNMTFLSQEGDRMFHNAEVAPVEVGGTKSCLSIHTASPGENLYHCNMYMRLKVPEAGGLIIESSIHRMRAINKHPPPKNYQEVIEILSDQTDDYFSVYQDIRLNDPVKTIATGIFDCVAKTWSIYTDKPNISKPIIVLPLQLKNKYSE